MKKRYVIIGGGPLGLSAAQTLLDEDHEVWVIDNGNALGGLATYQQFDGMLIDRFYHFFYLNDHHEAERFVKNSGAEFNVTWKNIKSSTFQANRFHDFDSPVAVLRLAGSSFFKVFFTFLKLKFFLPPDQLDSQSAIEWSRRSFGRPFSDAVWAPLLIDKFGDRHDRVSALWLATRIKRHLSTKVGIPPRSKFGYFEGTYKKSFENVLKKIECRGGKVLLNTRVTSLKLKNDKISSIEINGSSEITIDEDDIVLSTLPFSSLKHLFQKSDAQFNYLDKFKSVGVILVTLSLKVKLSDEYWTTVTDPKIPYKVIIQQNRLSARGDSELVYLSKYFYDPSGRFHQSDAQILESFLDGLKFMYPNLKDTDILESQVTRASVAAPVPEVDTARDIPGFQTPLINFFHGALEHIYPEDRGVGNSLRIGRELALECLKKINLD